MLALLSALDRFFTQGVLQDLGSAHEQQAFSTELVARLRQQMVNCRDVKKLLLILSVAIHLLHEGEGGTAPLPLLMILLGHRFPRVRKATAEQLYLKLLVCESLAAPEQSYDDLIEKLATTVWDAEDFAGLRSVRDEVCACLGVAAPQEKSKGTGVTRKEGASKENRPDEFASYASLVKDVGY